MENKEIIKSLIKCKIGIADQIISHLPEGARTNAAKIQRNLLKAFGEAVNEYFEEEKIESDTKKVKTINVE